MDEDGGSIFFLGFFIGLLIMFLILTVSVPTYMEGQVDALTGKIQYELIIKDDSTRVWEKKDK